MQYSLPAGGPTRDEEPPVGVTIPDLGTILVWVGGLTAILTLVFSLHRLSAMMGEARARRARVREALASADTQRQGGHFAAAWETLEEAARLAPRRTDVRTARAALAMEWLRRIRIRSGEQTFTEIVRSTNRERLRRTFDSSWKVVSVRSPLSDV
jgi:hypothetical protein